jgi:hypothetical protein
MNTKPNKWKLGAFTRRLIVFPALAVGVSLAFTGAAAAQTTVPFQASVDINTIAGKARAPVPPHPFQCPNSYYCGSANIAGYGAAVWSFDESPNVPVTSTGRDCAVYWGTSTFTLVTNPANTLVTNPANTLVLNEDGVEICNPGNSGNTPGFWGAPAYGHPARGNGPGTWTVCNAKALLHPDPTTGCGEPSPPDNVQFPAPTVSTGVFSTLTGGGTSTFRINGAPLEVTWSGTVTQ